MDLQVLKDWFMNLGTEYGVNPVIFVAIYVGAIPFFTLSIGWLIRNLKQKKPFVAPLFFSGFFFVSAYLYLVIVGKNVPVWVYFFIVALLVFGVYSTSKKIRKQLTQTEGV